MPNATDEQLAYAIERVATTAVFGELLWQTMVGLREGTVTRAEGQAIIRIVRRRNAEFRGTVRAVAAIVREHGRLKRFRQRFGDVSWRANDA